MTDRESVGEQHQSQSKSAGHGSSSEDDGASENGGQLMSQGEQELATKMLQIQSKRRFYLTSSRTAGAASSRWPRCNRSG
ncbi:hypothetical protein MRX96_053383 [Rhipicephalus microplus]